MNPLISVIVPVFKTEYYLKRCLDSLCGQSLHNIEIILVDDASPDKCSNICEKYAEKDARFRVLHNKTNQGLSVARNIGIKEARSDYLMFVDSDDWVHEDFCKAAYECVVGYQADLVMFRYEKVNNSRFESIVNKKTKSFSQSGYKKSMDAMILLQKGVGPTAWNKLYKKELFGDTSYPPGYLCEDIGTTYKIVWKASRIYYLDRVLYYYYQRSDSITSSKSDKFLRDWITMYMQQYSNLKEWGCPSDYLDALLMSISLGYCLMKKPDTSDSYYVYCANVLYSSKTVPLYFNRKQRIMTALFKYCSPLFEIISVLNGRKIY